MASLHHGRLITMPPSTPIHTTPAPYTTPTMPTPISTPNTPTITPLSPSSSSSFRTASASSLPPTDITDIDYGENEASTSAAPRAVSGRVRGRRLFEMQPLLYDNFSNQQAARLRRDALATVLASQPRHSVHKAQRLAANAIRVINLPLKEDGSARYQPLGVCADRSISKVEIDHLIAESEHLKIAIEYVSEDPKKRGDWTQFDEGTIYLAVFKKGTQFTCDVICHGGNTYFCGWDDQGYVGKAQAGVCERWVKSSSSHLSQARNNGDACKAITLMDAALAVAGTQNCLIFILDRVPSGHNISHALHECEMRLMQRFGTLGERGLNAVSGRKTNSSNSSIDCKVSERVLAEDMNRWHAGARIRLSPLQSITGGAFIRERKPLEQCTKGKKEPSQMSAEFANALALLHTIA